MTRIPTDLEQYRHALNQLRLPEFNRDKSAPQRVVALEGPNGVGKTTLCRSLADDLSASWSLGTDDAWFSKPFKTRMIRDAHWYASAMFFLSGCFEQSRLQRLNPAPLLIMDRSLWSTFAVHAAEDIGRLEKLLSMIRPIAAAIDVPDLTVVLEASFGTCQERIAHKEGEARALDLLTANEAFFAREQEFYRWLGRQMSSVVFLDADRTAPEEVTRQAIAALHAHRC